MTNVNKIIEDLGELISADYFSSGTVYLSDVEDLIHRHLDGYALVPIEPNDLMLEAGIEMLHATHGCQDDNVCMWIYKKMITAQGEIE